MVTVSAEVDYNALATKAIAKNAITQITEQMKNFPFRSEPISLIMVILSLHDNELHKLL